MCKLGLVRQKVISSKPTEPIKLCCQPLLLSLLFSLLTLSDQNIGERSTEFLLYLDFRFISGVIIIADIIEAVLCDWIIHLVLLCERFCLK